jgi:hypothetical protein
MYLIKGLIVVLSALSFQTASISPARQSTRLSEDIATLMRKHNQSGGIIEYNECRSNDQHFDMTSDSDLPAAFNSLPPSAHLRSRALRGSSTYLIEIGSPPNDTLMAIQLPDIVIDGSNLTIAANLLLTNKLVSAKATQLGIRFYDRDFGFSPGNKKDEKAASELKLPSGTLAEDLNHIAAQTPGAVWMFTQNSCNGSVTGSFAWVSR